MGFSKNFSQINIKKDFFLLSLSQSFPPSLPSFFPFSLPLPRPSLSPPFPLFSFFLFSFLMIASYFQAFPDQRAGVSGLPGANPTVPARPLVTMSDSFSLPAGLKPTGTCHFQQGPWGPETLRHDTGFAAAISSRR